MKISLSAVVAKAQAFRFEMFRQRWVVSPDDEAVTARNIVFRRKWRELVPAGAVFSPRD